LRLINPKYREYSPSVGTYSSVNIDKLKTRNPSCVILPKHPIKVRPIEIPKTDRDYGNVRDNRREGGSKKDMLLRKLSQQQQLTNELVAEVERAVKKKVKERANRQPCANELKLSKNYKIKIDEEMDRFPQYFTKRVTEALEDSFQLGQKIQRMRPAIR